MNIYQHQEKNIMKTWLMMISFFIIIGALGYLFSSLYNDISIFYFAIVFSLIMNVASYWYSDTIVLRMSGAIPADRTRYFDLWNTVENLSITAGLPMPKVYVIDDPAPNAFATGRNKEHAVVAVTTGLLSILDKNELEGVIAHELSHIGNRDMLVSTVAVVLVGFITLIADFFMRSLWFRDDRENRVHPILILIAVVLSILSPIVATLMQLAISRKREYLADASGALLTRYPEGLASALEKIAAASRPMRRANNATAHLFISNPFGKDLRNDRRSASAQKTGTIARLFMTHPPIEERIRILRGME
jgi:heat shock protein HtpX